MRTRRLPFCVILPLFSVSVWVILVALPVTFGYLHFRQISPALPAVSTNRAVSPDYEKLRLSIPPNQTLVFAALAVTEPVCRALLALNLPALPLEMLLSVGMWPHIWHPVALPLLRWRGVVYPLLALPAWFYIGTGVDALLGRVRLHLWDVVLSSVVVCAFSAGCLALTFGLPPGDQDPSLVSVGGGLGLWALLFAVVTVAWVKQEKPKAMRAMRVVFGVILGILVLWGCAYSSLPLWEVRSPSGSYSLDWHSGVVTLGVIVVTQIFSGLAFKRLKSVPRESTARENRV
jgi:hypothetical protein